jgi:hypothetical protein
VFAARPHQRPRRRRYKGTLTSVTKATFSNATGFPPIS